MKLLVCNCHVSKGIKEMSVPHVVKIKSNDQGQCFYCKSVAQIKLFIPVKCV